MGVGALGAELCHDEVAKGHRASYVCGGIFHSNLEYRKSFSAVTTAAAQGRQVLRVHMVLRCYWRCTVIL